MDVFIATDKGVCALVAWSLILCTGIRNLISNIRECMFRWSRLRESVYQLNIIHLCCITNMFNFWEQENHWNWRHPSPVLKPSAINFPIESTNFFFFHFFYSKTLLGSWKCVSALLLSMNNYVSGNNGLAFSMPRVCGMKSFRIKMLLFHVFVPIFMALMITNEQNFASMILLSCHSFFMPANPRHRINLFSPLNVLLVIWIPEQIAMGQCCKSMRLCYRSHSWKSKQFSLFHCFVFNILLRSVIFPTNIRSCVCVCVYDSRWSEHVALTFMESLNVVRNW